MEDLHEVKFRWPHPEASKVIVTGTFDQWSASLCCQRDDSGFSATVKVPWDQRIQYKFIVDGKWVVHDELPTEPDPAGNINNIYISPPKPALVASDSTTALLPSVEPKSGATVTNAESTPANGVIPESIATASSQVAEHIHTGGIIPVNQATSRKDDLSPHAAEPNGTAGCRESRSTSAGVLQEQTTPITANTDSKNVMPSDADQIAVPTIKTEDEISGVAASSKTQIATQSPEEPSTHTVVGGTAPTPLVPSTTIPDTVPRQETNTIQPINGDFTPSSPHPAETAGETEKTGTSSPAKDVSEAKSGDNAGNIPPAPTTPAPSAPTTPVKPQHTFPSSPARASVDGSPSSSKFSTTDSRKKRRSIFGKLAHLFKHDKEKEKMEK